MPFHIEVGSPVSFARVLNLDEVVLRKTVLEPWVLGLPVDLGEESWEPRESRLMILEGPTLPAGVNGDDDDWAVALRAAEDVTRPMLEAAEAGAPAQTAVVIEADSLEAALQELSAGRRPRQIPWTDAFKRIAGRDGEVSALILVVKPSPPGWPKL